MRKKKNYDELDYTVVLTEEPRHTIREFLFKSIRKLRCAGRVLKKIAVQVARRNTKAATTKLLSDKFALNELAWRINDFNEKPVRESV